MAYIWVDFEQIIHDQFNYDRGSQYLMSPLQLDGFIKIINFLGAKVAK